MLYIVCALLIFWLLAIWLEKVCNNPYTLTMVIGKKGSGKTSFCVAQMLKHLKKGWNVYTDIPSVDIKGVNKFTLEDIKNGRIPGDHSCIFFDEVGLSMDNRKFKQFPDELRDYFALQRHYKHKVFIVSQSPDCDLKVKVRIDHYILITRFGSAFSLVRPINRKVVLTQATSDNESKIAEQLKFSSIFDWRLLFLPRYFRAYDSFEGTIYRPAYNWDDGSIDPANVTKRRFFTNEAIRLFKQSKEKIKKFTLFRYRHRRKSASSKHDGME